MKRNGFHQQCFTPISPRKQAVLDYLEQHGGPARAFVALRCGSYGRGTKDSVLADLTMREPRLYECDDGRIGLLPKGLGEE